MLTFEPEEWADPEAAIVSKHDALSELEAALKGKPISVRCSSD